ncbi:hypothetical protein V3Q77_12400 [Flavobacterium davisii]
MFCHIYGFSYNNFVSMLKGNSPFGLKQLNKIHEALPKLNTHWLLYGEGPIELGGEAQTFSILKEEGEMYMNKDDMMEFILLKYLENENIQKRIVKIYKDDIKKKLTEEKFKQE